MSLSKLFCQRLIWIRAACFFSFTLITFTSFSVDKLRFTSVEGAFPQKISEAVLQKAYGDLGISVEILWQPAARALITANSGEADGELSRIKSIDQRYANLLRVEVPVNYLEVVVFSKNAGFKASGWDSLEPYRMGILRGMMIVERHTAGMNVDALDSFTPLFHMLDRDRIDILIAPKVVGLDLIKKLALSNIHINQETLIKVELYHFLHKRHKNLIPAIEKALQQMADSGEIVAIRDHYLNTLQNTNLKNNLHAEREVNQNTLHLGLPITSGEK